MDQPLVSVIIPAFNAEKYIRQTLLSVASQTHQNIEVFVVDDGSSDATASIVNEFAYSDARFYLIRQNNSGVGAARNTAIRNANGEYIAPLDADDLWFPEKLEKQVARMEQVGHETGMVYCWSKHIDQHGRYLCNGYSQALEGHLRHALILHNVLENASVPLFRAAVLHKVGLYLTRAEQRGAQGCEDWDLYLRIAEVSSIHVVPEYLMAYRQTHSTMSIDAGGMAASFTVALNRARMRNSDLPAAVFRWSAGYFYSYLADRSYDYSRYFHCLVCLKKAAFENPVLFLKRRTYKIAFRSVVNMVASSAESYLSRQTVPEKDDKKEPTCI
jgi:glycosyltransferase involved in cell wall biosynthesis